MDSLQKCSTLQKPGTEGFEKEKVRRLLRCGTFVLSTGGGVSLSHDLSGHPVPGHARLRGSLVAAHLQAYYALSLAKLLF